MQDKNKKYVKRIICLMLALGCSMSFAACKNEKSAEKSSAPESSGNQKAQELKAALDSIALEEGEQYTIILTLDGQKTENENYIYYSNNTAAVTVSNLGVITAVSEGESTITVSSPRSVNLITSIKVTVSKREESSSIIIDESSIDESSIDESSIDESSIDESSIDESSIEESSLDESSIVDSTYDDNDFEYDLLHNEWYSERFGDRVYYYVEEEIPGYVLSSLNVQQAQFLVNVLAAKHGHKFESKNLVEIFDNYTWYRSTPELIIPSTAPDESEITEGELIDEQMIKTGYEYQNYLKLHEITG